MTKGNYSYPLDSSWSTEEITTVLHFLSQVEKAYESKVDRDQEIIPTHSIHHGALRKLPQCFIF